MVSSLTSPYPGLLALIRGGFGGLIAKVSKATTLGLIPTTGSPFDVKGSIFLTAEICTAMPEYPAVGV